MSRYVFPQSCWLLWPFQHLSQTVKRCAEIVRNELDDSHIGGVGAGKRKTHLSLFQANWFATLLTQEYGTWSRYSLIWPVCHEKFSLHFQASTNFLPQCKRQQKRHPLQPDFTWINLKNTSPVSFFKLFYRFFRLKVFFSPCWRKAYAKPDVATRMCAVLIFSAHSVLQVAQTVWFHQTSALACFLYNLWQTANRTFNGFLSAMVFILSLFSFLWTDSPTLMDLRSSPIASYHGLLTLFSE